MRIAYIVTRADAVGGASIHVRDVASAMRERGHDVLVLIGGVGPVTDQLEARSVPFRTVPSLIREPRPLRDWRAWRELTRELLDWKPDLVSAHTAKAGWLGRAAARSAGIPAVYTPHGWSITDRMGRAKGRIYAVAERIAAPWCRAIVCVSESEKRLALQHRVGRPEQLHVIYNGVRDVPPLLRARPGENQPCRFISVARFEAPKDHETLLRAFARLDASLGCTLDLAGDGPNEPAIRELARQLGIAPRVRFLGYQPDSAAALAGAHAFVLASRSEGFPRSILEAMRAGLPVVASDVGGIPEAVSQGRSGVVVPPRDPAALAAALRDLAQDAHLRQRMGDVGHQMYNSRFRFERMLEATAELYGTLI